MEINVTHILLIAHFEGFVWRAIENWAPGILVLLLFSLSPFKRAPAACRKGLLFVAGYTLGLALVTPPVGYWPFELILLTGSLALFLHLLRRGWKEPLVKHRPAAVES